MSDLSNTTEIQVSENITQSSVISTTLVQQPSSTPLLSQPTTSTSLPTTSTIISTSSNTFKSTSAKPSLPPTTQISSTVSVKTPNVILCPELSVSHSSISTDDRQPGTIVRLQCEEGEAHSHISGPNILLCQNNGVWNSTIPTCHGSELEIPLSTKLFIGVLTACCALVLVVVLAILLKLWFGGKSKKPSRFSDRHHRLPRTSFDSLPPAPNPIHYQTHDRRYNIYQGTLNKTSDRNSVTYAKPEIYSTFINPTFYEDVYERWRQRESEEAYNETLYDSPWQHGKRPEQEESSGSDMRWSNVSLRAHDSYDYGRFGKIPRSQVCENTTKPEESDVTTL